MRTAAMFFLVICFYLLGGHHAAHAGRLHFAPATDLQKTLQAAGTNNDYVITKDDGLGLQYDHLLSIEEEDEDEDEFGARKLILLERYFLMLSQAIISSDLCKSSANDLPSCRHLSYIDSHKYIAQRVLRL
jgi:hypothetical protein